MMNVLDPKHVMQALYEALCDSYYRRDCPFVEGTDPKNVGLYFHLELRADNHGYEADGNTHRPEWERHDFFFFHAIILSDRRVYVLHSKERDLNDLKPQDFKNTSNHDSEWRSGLDGCHKIVFDLWESVYSHMPRNLQPIPKSSGVNGRLDPLFLTPFKYVRVKRKPFPRPVDGGYYDNYHDQLEDIKPIKFKIQLIED